jgi:hypothetical protein
MAKRDFIRTGPSTSRIVEADLKISGSLMLPAAEDNDDPQANAIAVQGGVLVLYDGEEWKEIEGGGDAPDLAPYAKLEGGNDFKGVQQSLTPGITPQPINAPGNIAFAEANFIAAIAAADYAAGRFPGFGFLIPGIDGIVLYYRPNIDGTGQGLYTLDINGIERRVAYSGEGGVSNFADLNGSPTDNTALSAALQEKKIYTDNQIQAALDGASVGYNIGLTQERNTAEIFFNRKVNIVSISPGPNISAVTFTLFKMVEGVLTPQTTRNTVSQINTDLSALSTSDATSGYYVYMIFTITPGDAIGGALAKFINL